MADVARIGDGSGRQQRSTAPFSTRLLKREDDQVVAAFQDGHDWPQSLLPALYRTETSDVAAASRDITACIKKELDLQRLTKIHDWLWVAGLPKPPRPLHNQLLILSRQIFITERMDMHLVWTTGRMFLKPMPRFLLEPGFWAEYLCCLDRCGCSRGENATSRDITQRCERRELRQCALGFLFSYAALICHESDFRIAQDRYLLPHEVRWLPWRKFVEELDTEHIYQDTDPRFHYGELRLSRLNKIYAVSQTPLRGYMARWDRYGAFFRDNFAWLASVTVYIAIILAAMQVGLATKSLGQNDAFQSASYGFTIFAILGPLIAGSLIMLAFCCVFIYNWLNAVNYGKRRGNRKG